MDVPPRRDVNELLTNGFFTTSRGKSPSKAGIPPTSAQPFLQTSSHEAPTIRSPSRDPYSKPPPRPTVEEEPVSLSREFSSLGVPSYDPPLRGIIDQNPIILEAEVTAAEAAILQAKPCTEADVTNPERRFVLIPKSDTYLPNELDEAPLKSPSGQTRPRSQEGRTRQDDSGRREEVNKRAPSPAGDRRPSRQDLPSLETKLPRALPPQFRRSASAYASTPTKDRESATKTSSSRTPAGEPFLSPNVTRPAKDYFEQASQSAPRQHAKESFGGRATPTAEKRQSGASFSGPSYPATPNSDKRHSDSFETTPRSRRNTSEKMSRPQQLSGEAASRKSERQSSGHSNRSSIGLDRPRSPKSSSHRHLYISSDEDLADSSDSDHHHKDHRRRHHRNLAPDHPHDKHLRSPSRTNRSSIDEKRKPTSRQTSPLPSPKGSPKGPSNQLPTATHFERSGTFPQTRDSRRPSSRPVSPLSMQDAPRKSEGLTPVDASSARPRSKQSSAIPVPDRKLEQTLPIPIPTRIDLHSPGDTRRTPSIPTFDDSNQSSARPDVAKKPWQPPSFQPPPSSLEKPIGSYRRYSEEIERGSVAPLPPCPRTSPTRGRNDWLTLPQCSNFNICPSCFNSIIGPTEFGSMFVPSPRRSAESDVVCDFGSSPWYRIAWLLTLKERRRDLKLFYGLANICATIQPCLGRHEAVRQWYSIVDPKTGSTIRNFDVCYSCVKSVETVLPDIRGIFVRSDSHAPPNAPRVCDLRFDSKRFIQYFDALETTADSADDDQDPDTRELANLVRRLASIDECQKDVELADRRWHIITQLPEFTVCPECFEEVVWPELDEGKAIPMMFNKTLQRIPKTSCQLYSPRMRTIFQTAVDKNDYKALASKARERKTIELAYRANIGELKRRSHGLGKEATEKEIKKVTDEWRKWE